MKAPFKNDGLAEDVDIRRDHIRGPEDAPITLVEYGDFECPHCGGAERSTGGCTAGAARESP